MIKDHYIVVMSGGVYLFQGVRLEVVDETDLDICKSLAPSRYEDFMRAHQMGYCESSKSDSGHHLYYEASRTKYLYIGLPLQQHEMVSYNSGSVKISFPSNDEVETFKSFCTSNNINVDTFGTYMFTYNF